MIRGYFGLMVTEEKTRVISQNDRLIMLITLVFDGQIETNS